MSGTAFCWLTAASCCRNGASDLSGSRHRHPVGRTVPQREVDAIALAHVNDRTGNAAAERPRLEAHLGCDLDFLRDDVEPDVVRPVAGLQLGDEGQVRHGIAFGQRSAHVRRVEYLRSRRAPDLVSGGFSARPDREGDNGDGGKGQDDGRKGQTAVLCTHVCFSMPARHIHAAARENNTLVSRWTYSCISCSNSSRPR